MKVELIRYTPEPEKLVAAAAKLCYSKVGIDGILEGLDESKTEKFLNMLMDLGHESPIEHVSFTFGVEGISRVLSHQLVRHRIGCSYSQQSQRYVKLDQFEYIIPPQIEENDEARQLFIDAMKRDQEVYDKLVEILYKENYKKYIEEGKTEKQAAQMAEKVSIEDARYVFPNACETKIVFTMSARALLNFFRMRCCERAQWEIREMATEMLKKVREVAPILFKNAGPGCLNGPCPEGNMSCGKLPQIREKFKTL
ncbi:FAD-dependent thymidylate synthase [Lutispora thermophila]|uniref:Flavin-dependent thymidylate synthase n=1 Tax=Lutispora thermophila DSM 19022 TaxID=1122184 RepID=A0A1M6IAM3_9FIRM|nr:FAD-dependent thymidylate synthase [Lutispora thermophila]SHJ31482.1 thymidylate synthase (FAD) [Lutispora thermophila DSM 19022]